MKYALILLPYLLLVSSCRHESNPAAKKDSSLSEHKETLPQNAAKEPQIRDTTIIFRDKLFEARTDNNIRFVPNGTVIDSTKERIAADLGDTLVICNANCYLEVFQRYTPPFQFHQFPVRKLYTGKLASPNLSSHPNARYWRGQLRYGCENEGVNFAGQLTAIVWGCGTMCTGIGFVNRKNGNVHFAADDMRDYDGHYGYGFETDSRLLITNYYSLLEHPGYCAPYGGKPQYYLWTGKNFRRIG